MRILDLGFSKISEMCSNFNPFRMKLWRGQQDDSSRDEEEEEGESSEEVDLWQNNYT